MSAIVLFAVGGVGEAGEDVLLGEGREVVEDVVGCHASSEIGQDIIDGDAQAPDAGFARAFPRFQGDAPCLLFGGV
jgi:hypothetical protein